MSDRQLRCPSCDGRMREVDRRGVHVDICNECRGVFLDRGELDKLMDAVEDYSMSQIATVAQAQQHQQPHYGPSHAPPPAPGHHQPAHPQHKSAMSEAAELVKEALAHQQRKQHHGRGYGYGYKKKRRGGLLGEILDF